MGGWREVLARLPPLYTERLEHRQAYPASSKLLWLYQQSHYYTAKNLTTRNHEQKTINSYVEL